MTSIEDSPHHVNGLFILSQVTEIRETRSLKKWERRVQGSRYCEYPLLVTLKYHPLVTGSALNNLIIKDGK